MSGKDITRVLRSCKSENATVFYDGDTTKRYTWKWFGGKVRGTWAGRSGKWYKKQLSKSRRRYYKDIDNNRRPRGSYNNWNSWCNWRGW